MAMYGDEFPMGASLHSMGQPRQNLMGVTIAGEEGIHILCVSGKGFTYVLLIRLPAVHCIPFTEGIEVHATS